MNPFRSGRWKILKWRMNPCGTLPVPVFNLKTAGGRHHVKNAVAFISLYLLCALPIMEGAEAEGNLGEGKLDIKRHDMSLVIRPDEHMLEAVDLITFKAGSTGLYTLFLGSRFEIEKLFLDGKKIQFEEIGGAELIKETGMDEDFIREQKGFRFHVHKVGGPDSILEIRYHGVVYDTLEVPEYSRGTLAEETTGIIGAEGVFLSPETHWYPDQPDGYAFYSIKAKTPAGMESLVEGRLVQKRRSEETTETEWDVSYPTRGVYLIAGNYIVEERESDGVKVMAYFFPSEKDLIGGYLDASSRYIEMYNKLIGPYPFSKFAVVENFFPTGYGMPSYTLLGRRVIRLPFIVHTSLGHEVAHNWWGNSVYVDYDGGNWCEGLTVYFADYRYKEMMSDSAATAYRRTINIDFTSYVTTDNDSPLSEFHERTTPASRSIGYGKCAMVFHMLRQRVGEETFFRALRSFYRDYQFQEASWGDIHKTFERVSGQDLGPYFEQWVQRKGAPMLSLGDCVLGSVTGGYHVQVTLRQEPVFDLLVPIAIQGEDTTVHTSVELTQEEEAFRFEVDFKPSSITIDPAYDVFRRLGPLEIPPTISTALGDKRAVIALPSRADGEKRDVFLVLAGQLGKTGEGRVMVDTTVTELAVREGAVIILGNPKENTVYSLVDLPTEISFASDHFSVGGIGYSEPGHSTFITFRNPLNAAASVCIVAGNSVESVRQSGHKIIHYGKYSYVTFLDGERLKAGVFPVKDNPLFRRIQSP